MAPTVSQNRGNPERPKRPPPDKRSDLVCRVKYCNTLHDIPFDTKFINYPFSADRYQSHKATVLEKNYKHEILTEQDLGVTIDLINPDAYTGRPGMELHPHDERLLEDEVLMPQDAKKSRHQHVNVSWLRRTEYISTEMTRYQPQTMDKIEATVGYATKRNSKKQEEDAYTDRDSQLEAIERTFDTVKRPLTNHYSKPGVSAVEELELFPDFETWKYPCAQVIFDSDPAPTGCSVPAQMEQMSQAMIRGIVDESGDQFVAYFLPTEETLAKRKQDKEEGIPYRDEEEYDYNKAREFNWNVKNKLSKGYEENYFFVLRGKHVYYNELETRVRLNKRRLNKGQKPSRSRLVVKHRPLNEGEHRAQRMREKALEPPGDEDEFEEDVEMASDQEDDDQMSVGSGSGNESPRNSDNESGDEGAGGSGDESARGSGDESARGSGDESARGSGDESARGSGDESARGSGDESGRGSGDESAKSSEDEGSVGSRGSRNSKSGSAESDSDGEL